MSNEAHMEVRRMAKEMLERIGAEQGQRSIVISARDGARISNISIAGGGNVVSGGDVVVGLKADTKTQASKEVSGPEELEVRLERLVVDQREADHNEYLQSRREVLKANALRYLFILSLCSLATIAACALAWSIVGLWGG